MAVRLNLAVRGLFATPVAARAVPASPSAMAVSATRRRMELHSLS